MEKEMKTAENIIRAYKLSREKGILALRNYDFICEDFKFAANIALDCLQKNLTPEQIYEILNNYKSDFENEIIHKLTVEGIMCIIAGDSADYLKELTASILGKKYRNDFLRTADGILPCENTKEAVIKKYCDKQAFSQKTDLLKDKLNDREKLKSALSKTDNKDIHAVLTGASGETAKKILDVIDFDLLKAINEDSFEEIDENTVIIAENKLAGML
ncbi:MAG: hypothetical protein J1F64_10575 [Oscillospiraceae bacterium]|nr:hypothetical protein [Oscillospiraceae bacterium]